MTEEPNEADQRPKPVIPAQARDNPLSYEAPRDRLLRDPPANMFGATLVAFISLVISAGAAFLLNAYIFIGMNGLDTYGRENRHPMANRVIGCLYLGGSAALATAIFRHKIPASERISVARWSVLGSLIGLGIACLLEGLCFASR